MIWATKRGVTYKYPIHTKGWITNKWSKRWGNCLMIEKLSDALRDQRYTYKCTLWGTNEFQWRQQPSELLPIASSSLLTPTPFPLPLLWRLPSPSLTKWFPFRQHSHLHSHSRIIPRVYFPTKSCGFRNRRCTHIRWWFHHWPLPLPLPAQPPRRESVLCSGKS